MILYPYKNGSKGAKGLADALGIIQIKKEGSKFRGSNNKLVINWGNSMSTEEVDKCAVLNKPASVAICSNKLSFFRHILANNNNNVADYVEIPWFTDNKEEALNLTFDGHKIVCRTVLNGHSGEGIVIADRAEQIVDAPLYVEYRPKKTEYRVHVLNGQVVDVQRKARDHSVPEDKVNWQVRNHQFGFVFVRDEEPDKIPRGVLTNAVSAVKVVGLDFGAVDVIYNEKQNRASVLEINTAPGLQGSTLEGYTKRFEEIGNVYKEVLKKNSKLAGNRLLGMALDEVMLDNRLFINERMRAVPQAIPVPVAQVEQIWNANFDQMVRMDAQLAAAVPPRRRR